MAEEHYLDEIDEPDPELNRISNQVIGAAIAVHRAIGPGQAEGMYGNAFAIELRARGVRFRREVKFPVHYRGEPIGEVRLDFLVEEKVIVELKSVELLTKLHSAQLLSYLRLTHLRLGILINFNVPALKDGLRRIAN